MSQTQKFKSRYGPDSISGPQFLAEVMCERLAASRKEVLGAYFWEDPWWLTKFKAQLTHANKLLKEYSVEEILQVLKDPDLKRIYSLGVKNVRLLLNRQRQREERRSKQGSVHSVVNNQTQEPLKVDTGAAPRKPFSTSNSKLSKLRKLSNG